MADPDEIIEHKKWASDRNRYAHFSCSAPG
jgi:hypothetical protein